MTTVLYLACVLGCWWFGSTNGLLAILAVGVLEIALATVRIREGVADVYRLLDDERRASSSTTASDEPARDQGLPTPVEIAPGVVGWMASSQGRH